MADNIIATEPAITGGQQLPPPVSIASEIKPKADDGTVPRYRFNEVNERNKTLANSLKETTDRINQLEGKFNELQDRTRPPMPDPTLDPQGYANFVSEGARMATEKANRKPFAPVEINHDANDTQTPNLHILEARMMSSHPDYLTIVNKESIGKHLSQQEQAWIMASTNPPEIAYELLRGRINNQAQIREANVNQGQVSGAQPAVIVHPDNAPTDLTEDEKTLAFSFYGRKGFTREQAYKTYSDSKKQNNASRGIK